MTEDQNNKNKICSCGHENEAGENMSTRRLFLQSAACAMVGVGGLCLTAPLLDAASLEDETSANKPVEVDLSDLKEGEAKTVLWKQHPVFIRRRTAMEIKAMREVALSDLKHAETDEARTAASVYNNSLLPEWLVVVGVCPHLGCVPLGQKAGEDRGDFGGWVCPCHASHFDASGRVRKGPSSKNLEIPPYVFLSFDRIRIG